MSAESAPLIVSALLASQDFAWLDGLRRAHYPAERNRVPAHMTLFRHLPPSLAPELKGRLAEATRARRPSARTIGLIDLDGGVAVRIASPELEATRAELALSFAGLLTPQDIAGWLPHVTIQNKVPPAEARRLRAELAANFVQRPISIEGLAIWAYRDGRWEPHSRHMFRI